MSKCISSFLIIRIRRFDTNTLIFAQISENLRLYADCHCRNGAQVLDSALRGGLLFVMIFPEILCAFYEVINAYKMINAYEKINVYKIMNVYENDKWKEG